MFDMSVMACARCFLPFVAAMALVASIQLVETLDMKYCATINTGTTDTNSSIWQSDGLCFNFCNDQSFSFAIVQEHSCWCSDFVPVQSSQVDTGKCDIKCPGWQPDTCGGDGLFGYIDLARVPSGTAAGSSTSATSTPTSTSTDSSSKSTDSTASSPNTTLRTLTAGGSVSVETITVTPVSAHGSGETTFNRTPTTGTIAGIVVGVLVGLAVLVGAAVFYIRRMRRQHEDELASRSQSHLSGSVGMMSTPTTTMGPAWEGEKASTARRNSRLMAHDPRMDPFAVNIYNRLDNKSRESINTLQDNQDYSRKVLRTTNPDPPDN
ncbi:hypothetical protein GGR50DRAFT_387692 [Xylaria sp. CBS 124048]|nr:hypothetical protein GGR50DRAFT_387692 [Xylaria sp. CBS 124048]